MRFKGSTGVDGNPDQNLKILEPSFLSVWFEAQNVLSVTNPKSPISGGHISLYLLTINMALTPTSCSIFLGTQLFCVNWSIMETVMCVVFCSDWNFIWTCISQSIRMVLIFPMTSQPTRYFGLTAYCFPSCLR